MNLKSKSNDNVNKKQNRKGCKLIMVSTNKHHKHHKHEVCKAKGCQMDVKSIPIFQIQIVAEVDGRWQ